MIVPSESVNVWMCLSLPLPRSSNNNKENDAGKSSGQVLLRDTPQPAPGKQSQQTLQAHQQRILVRHSSSRVVLGMCKTQVHRLSWHTICAFSFLLTFHSCPESLFFYSQLTHAPNWNAHPSHSSCPTPNTAPTHVAFACRIFYKYERSIIFGKYIISTDTIRRDATSALWRVRGAGFECNRDPYCIWFPETENETMCIVIVVFLRGFLGLNFI